MLWYIVGGFALLTVVFYFLNKTAFRRIFQAANAQLSEVGRAAENFDHIAIMQDRRDKASETLLEMIELQGEIRGQVEGLKRQVEDGKVQIARLDAKIRSALNVGDEERAAQHAISMQREKEQLATNEKQLATQLKSDEAGMKRIKMFEATIQDIDNRAKQLKIDLRSSEVERKLGEKMSKLNTTVDMESVYEADRKARERIDANRGAAAVRAELNNKTIKDYEDQEAERNEQAKSILEQYKKGM